MDSFESANNLAESLIDSPYYYLSTVQKPTSIQKCILANFIVSKYEENKQQSQDISDLKINQNESTIKYRVQKNIIFAQSDYVRIFNIVEQPSEDQPNQTVQPVSEKLKQNQSEIGYDDSQFLFILTQNLHCMLLGFNRINQKAELISKGYLKDENCIQREQPYPLFLSQNKKYIVLMLYENIIKIIPIIQNPLSRIQLNSAFNIRIIHPEIIQLIPINSLADEERNNSKQPNLQPFKNQQIIGVFVSQKTSDLTQSINPSNKRQLVVYKYYIDFNNQELKPIQVQETSKKVDWKLEFLSSHIYCVEPLPFGGILAFDQEFLYLYLGSRNLCCQAIKLRNSLIISSLLQIDEYDQQTKRIKKSGSNLLRYLAGTEQGQVYMIAFNLQLINQMKGETLLQIKNGAYEDIDSQLVCIEFLGARLSSCSSMIYLGGEGYIYYASNAGDSYILQIQSEQVEHSSNQEIDSINPNFNIELNAVDRPYIKIIEEHQSLAPILGIEILQKLDLNSKSYKNQSQVQCQSNEQQDFKKIQVQSREHRKELMVLSGSNHTSHINIIQNGISIKEHLIIEDLPSINSQNGLFSAGNKLFLKVFGQPNFIVSKISFTDSQNNQQCLKFEELNTTNFKLEQEEQVLCIQEVNTETKKKDIIMITDRQIKIFSNDLNTVVYEFKIPEHSSIVCADYKQDTLLISLFNDSLLIYTLNCLIAQTQNQYQLVQEDTIDFSISKLNIGQISLSNDAQTALVSFENSPEYQIHLFQIIQSQSNFNNLLTTKKIVKLESKSLLQILEKDLYDSIIEDYKLNSKNKILNDSEQSFENLLTTSQLAQRIPSLVVKGIQNLSHYSFNPSGVPAIQKDFYICTFSDGRTLSICLDRSRLIQSSNNNEIPSYLDDFQIHYFGTLQANLYKFEDNVNNKQIVLVSCDRPGLFFIEDGHLQMFLCEDVFQQACSLHINFVHNNKPNLFSLIAFKNYQGQIVLGSLEPQTKLQTKRIGFRKQINKVIAISDLEGSELLVASIEEPDFGYLDPNRPNAVNLIALISKQTFKTIDMFKLERFEVVNCLIQIQKQVSGLAYQNWETKNQYSASRHSYKTFIFVGTSFLTEETMPSKGRILIFKIQPKSCRLQLLHQIEKNGSVQQINTLLQNSKYIVFAINNRIDLYQFNLKLGDNFDFIFCDSKVAGTFLQIVKTIKNQIVVGDIMKGIIVFDLKEHRSNKVVLMEGPSSPHSNIWVNDILILSENKYLVVDKEMNILIFQRNIMPVNEVQSYKLEIAAQINFGEEVTSTVIGSMGVSNKQNLSENQQTKQVDQQIITNNSQNYNQVQLTTQDKFSFINNDQQINQKLNFQNVNNQMTLMRKKNTKKETKQNEDNEIGDGIQKEDIKLEIDQILKQQLQKLNPTQDFIRQLCTITLQQLKHLQTLKQVQQALQASQNQSQQIHTGFELCYNQSVIFGTVEGSIGQLNAIPKFTFMFLKRLQEVMEHHVRGISRITNSDMRQVKFDNKQAEQALNIIDGSFIEQFVCLDPQVQSKIVQNMLLNSKDMCEDYLMQVKQVIQILQQLH